MGDLATILLVIGALLLILWDQRQWRHRSVDTSTHKTSATNSKVLSIEKRSHVEQNSASADNSSAPRVERSGVTLVRTLPEVNPRTLRKDWNEHEHRN